ncbi:acyl-CoA thioesterase-1 [Marisediminitalea aggregata]|uniref:Acyl-CoA thioesterase-1 n=1 Tax=Marisediminitalea aggregata TaxID=634436 RepID=A0A1M5K6E6_9ALTE|nr:arylesterase [Marisediminitalea aggregata]MEC7471358.1 arylesterase [Pseudomonadota bacterium]BBO27033.1 arylesterase [Alteromonas sp. I4]MCP9478915.1 arylesterase [Marisediminitalea aggregata]MEC7826609.1 arylesterase [Pseudomonadota bacterium]SHG47813.1 acyl-CoA thioesterase-1 [Marisediminitalea aggregata]
MFRNALNSLITSCKQVSKLVLVIPLLMYSDHLLAADDRSTDASVGQTAEIKLLILGDSLSAGYGLLQAQSWVSLLQNIWLDENRKVEVINAAISGETSDGGLARLPRLLDQHAPTHVLIELGGNDGLQGHNVTKLQENLSKMIELVKAEGAEVYLQDMEIPTNYGRRYNQLFGNSFDTVAAQQNVTLVPFFMQDIALNDELMQRDGIHPNEKGQPLIAEFMHGQLTPLLFSN